MDSKTTFTTSLQSTGLDIIHWLYQMKADFELKVQNNVWTLSGLTPQFVEECEDWIRPAYWAIRKAKEICRTDLLPQLRASTQYIPAETITANTEPKATF